MGTGCINTYPPVTVNGIPLGERINLLKCVAAMYRWLHDSGEVWLAGGYGSTQARTETYQLMEEPSLSSVGPLSNSRFDPDEPQPAGPADNR